MAALRSRRDPEQIVRSYLHRLLVDRDLSVREERLADDYLDHDAPGDAPRGPVSTRASVTQMLAGYPDLRFTIEELVAVGQLTAMRARGRALTAARVAARVRRGGRSAWSCCAWNRSGAGREVGAVGADRGAMVRLR